VLLLLPLLLLLLLLLPLPLLLLPLPLLLWSLTWALEAEASTHSLPSRRERCANHKRLVGGWGPHSTRGWCDWELCCFPAWYVSPKPWPAHCSDRNRNKIGLEQQGTAGNRGVGQF
jgi:hypothetical protein